MRETNVLVIVTPGTAELGHALARLLSARTDTGLRCRTEFLAAAGLQAFVRGLSRASRRPDLAFLLPLATAGTEAGEWLPALRQAAPQLPVVAVFESDQPGAALALLKLGISDFITTPLKAVDILPRLWRLLGHVPDDAALVQTLREKFGLRQLIGVSPSFEAEVRKIPVFAQCDASVLISGETGTGKELCARAIHYLSPRARRPFVPINCGAIPLELVENELFGHERGAFTGAATAEAGLIQEADGGTIFFDEVDCLPLLAQVKLLRFLQEKEYRPLGSTRTRKSNVRVVAATNSDLARAVREGKLRQDLFYRLNTIPLTLPPLRARVEDIMLLAQHFLTKYAAEFGKQAHSFTPEARQALLLYDWPGNVRELEHVVQRAVALSEQTCIRGQDIMIPNWSAPAVEEPFNRLKGRMIEQFERNYISQLLQACQGNITRAAGIAQKNRRAFWQLIRKHGIDVKAFKPTP
jgi:DNA-binding NtrC family response regulator